MKTKVYFKIVVDSKRKEVKTMAKDKITGNYGCITIDKADDNQETKVTDKITGSYGCLTVKTNK